MADPKAALTWIFERDDALITIERNAVDARPRLELRRHSGGAETQEFPDAGAATEFQAQLEKRLVTAGWRLTAFLPERRKCAAHEGFVLTERRRLLDPSRLSR